MIEIEEDDENYSILRPYLEKVSANRGSLEGLVLSNGASFLPAPRPSGVRKQRNGECFKNAYKLAEKTGLTYVEGFALDPACHIPLHHAWNVEKDGTVVDTTWDPVGFEYIGVPLRLEYVRKQLLAKGTWGAFTPGTLVFVEGLPPEAVADWRKDGNSD